MNIVLGLGSNLGEREVLIHEAINKLENKLGSLVSISSLIETKPWGFESDNLFLNCAAVFKTNLNPEEVLSICLETEAELGRDRSQPKEGYQSRTIDIDILLIDNLIINTPILQVPHPLIQFREFVLNPLREIIPQWIHPILHQKIKDLILQTP